MKLPAFQVHKSWLTRTALLLVVTALAVSATAWFVQRPILWCTLIASSLPLTLFVFVVMPTLRQESRKS